VNNINDVCIEEVKLQNQLQDIGRAKSELQKKSQALQRVSPLEIESAKREIEISLKVCCRRFVGLILNSEWTLMNC
jgi:hypothetical protein